MRLVGNILAAKDKDRMLLERGARLLVRGGVRRDLGEGHAAQLGGEARTQRNDFHRRALHRFGVSSTFPQNRPAGKEALYAWEIGLLLPRVCTLAHAVDEADQFLLPSGLAPMMTSQQSV
jgi:hypothetical protein